ncbi:hypothetical protein OROHE_021110 [Orobanche hederae]
MAKLRHGNSTMLGIHGTVRLFMQSFSNEQSPNEPYELLPQCSYT